MIKFILHLSRVILVLSHLLIKNVDVEPLTLKVLDGSNGFRYSYLIQPKSDIKMPFYGSAIRMWPIYENTKLDKGFTLFEFTRILKSEELAVMDISFVDGFNSNINLYSNKYNISTRFGEGTCEMARGFYKDGVCLSPCLTYNDDFLCCRGKYSSPQTCSRLGEPIAYENKIWKNTIRSVTIPPKIYTYAYDDKSGTLSAIDDNVVLEFYRVNVLNTISN